MKGHITLAGNPADGRDALKVGLVACAKSKRDDSAPARELYVSDLFKKAAKYSEKNYDQWYMLSAKHGLVEPTKVLHPYDETLKLKSKVEQQEWALRVFQQLVSCLPKPEECELFFHAGAEYRRQLMGMLVAKGYDCKVPLEGLAIGEQLAWYVAHS